MARGRNYYDPIMQAPSRVETGGERRIELYPEHDVRDNAENSKWVARLIDEQGRVVQYSPGSFDHDDALRQAQAMWPGLQVFELREESEDSTWDGMGPSPRLWQQHQVFGESQVGEAISPAVEHGPASYISDRTTTISISPDSPTGGNVTPAVDEERMEVVTFRLEMPGNYVRLEDILALLESYAGQFDRENNPSAALGLREAADALREPF